MIQNRPMRRKEKVMTNSGLIVILLFSMFLSVETKAFADTSGTQPIAAEFREIDVNHDRALTLEEMQAYQEKKFNESDKDKNGELDAKESSADQTRMMGGADTNKDEKVTKEESASQFKQYFENLDANKDNKVSEDEYTDYWKLRIKF